MEWLCSYATTCGRQRRPDENACEKLPRYARATVHEFNTRFLSVHLNQRGGLSLDSSYFPLTSRRKTVCVSTSLNRMQLARPSIRASGCPLTLRVRLLSESTQQVKNGHSRTPISCAPGKYSRQAQLLVTSVEGTLLIGSLTTECNLLAGFAIHAYFVSNCLILRLKLSSSSSGDEVD
jgi:hypothetical protein